MSKPLTERQQEVLDFIVEHHATFRICPTTREIQARFGFASQTAAMNHLKALIRNGAPISKTASRRLVYHDPSERIPWEDVAPFISIVSVRNPKLVETFFSKYPHLRNA